MTDESQNTDTSAGTQNTDTSVGADNTAGQDSRPSSEDRSQWVSQGIGIGAERVLKKLGLPPDLDEAMEAFQTLRSPKSDPGNGASETNISEHPEYQTLTKELGSYQRKSTEQDKLIKQLQGQADEARLEKIRSSALAAGVGAGKQLDAFLSLYQDRLVFGKDRNLEVLGRLNDGTMAPMGQSLDEFISEALEESPFLKVPSRGQGGGSSLGATRNPEPVDRSGDYDPKSNYEAFGVTTPGSSRLDRALGRTRSEEK